MDSGFFLGGDDGGIRHDEFISLTWIEQPVVHQYEHPVDPSGRALEDKKLNSESACARRVGWMMTSMSSENHYVVGEKPNCSPQGFSICGKQQHEFAAWLAENPALQRCPECLQLLPRLL